MALTTTDIDIQVMIGQGLPTAGEVTKGGIVLSLDATGTELIGIATSTDGTDITVLKTNDDNALTLEGKTLSEVIADAVAAAKVDIIDGADAAYDTLLEIQNELQNNDTDIATILTNQANKVDKVNGKSLILDTEIDRLATLHNTVLSDALDSTSTTEALSLKGAKDLKDQIDNIPVSRVFTY